MTLAFIAGTSAALTNESPAGDAAARQGSAGSELQLAVGFDAHRAWISAQYKQLGLRKQTASDPLATSVELRYGTDTVGVSYAPDDSVVSRGRQSLALDSQQAVERLQDLFGGSPAVFAARAALAELEAAHQWRAPEMSVLSSLAFVALLAGDVDAPRRVADRFTATHGVRATRSSTCWNKYQTDVCGACNDLHESMREANQHGSFIDGAYRQLALTVMWLVRLEAAWVEYLRCLQPVKIVR